MELFLFFGRMQANFIHVNMLANFKWLDYFLKSIKHRSQVFYIELFKHLGGTLENVENSAIAPRFSLRFSCALSDLPRVYITR